MKIELKSSNLLSLGEFFYKIKNMGRTLRIELISSHFLSLTWFLHETRSMRHSVKIKLANNGLLDELVNHNTLRGEHSMV